MCGVIYMLYIKKIEENNEQLNKTLPLLMLAWNKSKVIMPSHLLQAEMQLPEAHHNSIYQPVTLARYHSRVSNLPTVLAVIHLCETWFNAKPITKIRIKYLGYFLKSLSAWLFLSLLSHVINPVGYCLFSVRHFGTVKYINLMVRSRKIINRYHKISLKNTGSSVDLERDDVID